MERVGKMFCCGMVHGPGMRSWMGPCFCAMYRSFVGDVSAVMGGLSIEDYPGLRWSCLNAGAGDAGD